MRAIVIGGTGMIGTYLIPRLVKAGIEVVNISRQQRTPIFNSELNLKVKYVKMNRLVLEQEKKFGDFVIQLNPDIVIDLICFEIESANEMVKSIGNKNIHYLNCGTIWVYGWSRNVLTKESDQRKPLGSYGQKKAAIEKILLLQANKNNFNVTVLHPGHIVGKLRNPINPVGNLNTDVFKKLKQEEEIFIPDNGMKTLHHVHADDVAQGFMNAILYKEKCLGEAINIVSPYSITMRYYAEEVASWYGKKPILNFLPWQQWKKMVSVDEAEITWDHLIHSPNCSIEKAKKLIEYNPAYTSLEAIKETIFESL